MGVRDFGGTGLMPAMSNEHPSNGSPLNVSVDVIGGMPMDTLLDISDSSETFKNEKGEYKSVLCDEVRSVSEDTPLSGLVYEGSITVGKMQSDNVSLRSAHELSTSLPNLNVSINTDPEHTVNEVNIRNSLSDIFSKPNQFGFSRGTLCPGKNGSLSELKALETMRDDDSLLNPGENGQHLCSAQETDSNGNRLSGVLQSIPPSKRQVSMPNAKRTEVAVRQEWLGGCDGSNLSNNPSCERTQAVITGNISSAVGGDAQCVALRTPAGRTNVDTDDGHPGATLSQESDVSNRSSCQTVIDVEQERTSSNMVESLQNDSYDDSCIDETTTFDVRRSDIMSSDHCCDRLSKADASSFSSISSLGTGTDLSASANSCSDDIGDSLEAAADFPDDRFVDINLHPGNTYERSKTLGSEDSGFDEKQMHQFDTKPKRRGITEFLTRGFFSRKPKSQPEDVPCDSGLLGWKFFGRVPPKQSSSSKNAEQISREFLEKQKPSPTPSLASSTSSASIRKGDVEVLSTTALILEQRPRGLPSKSPEEEEKHRLEYEAMIEAAKRKEAKDVKLRKKQVELQLRHEDELSAALAVWRNDILPNWDTTKSCKKTRDLWWNGVPPSVRGQVWKLAIGNELNLTPELYEICLLRAKDKLKLLKETAGDTDSITSVESAVSKESSVELIKLDVSRTFPQLCIFQKGGPYHELLQSLLGAYVCYRPDVGYVQGMSFIAAVLLLNMDVADAFICFANLLNRPCTIAFFRLDESLVKCYFDTYELLFAENLPVLYEHFDKQKVTADLYVIDWMFTLYARSLPLDIASRAWDVFFRDGEEFLFRMALGILKMYEDILLNLDFIHLAQFLTRLPETMNPDELFHSIDTIHMTVDKRPFQRVLLDCKDREM